jgi:AcrR family transcriptional regulator
MTPPGRARDSSTTRAALLTAARELFASEGYDATTVRAVADRAGVNQALLFRHFGNKEGLFAESVRGDAMELLADGARRDLLERTLTAILDPHSGTSAELVTAVLRATVSSTIGEEVRAELSAAFTSAFAAQADTDSPDDAIARAELLLAWLLGIVLMRRMSPHREPLDPETVKRHVLRVAGTLLAQ